MKYCQECDAVISLTIRLRHSGEIVFFDSDRSWPPSKEQLVGGSINPVRRLETNQLRQRTIQGPNRSLRRKLRLDISHKHLTQTRALMLHSILLLSPQNMTYRLRQNPTQLLPLGIRPRTLRPVSYLG